MSLTHSQSRFAVDSGSLGWMYGESDGRTPEQRLMLAMVERAIRDFIGGSRSEARDAESWLFAPIRSREAELFSFAWVCSELSLDHAGVLGRLKATLALSKRGSLPFFLDKRFIDRSERARGEVPPEENIDARPSTRSKPSHLATRNRSLSSGLNRGGINRMPPPAKPRSSRGSDAKRWM